MQFCGRWRHAFSYYRSPSKKRVKKTCQSNYVTIWSVLNGYFCCSYYSCLFCVLWVSKSRKRERMVAMLLPFSEFSVIIHESCLLIDLFCFQRVFRNWRRKSRREKVVDLEEVGFWLIFILAVYKHWNAAYARCTMFAGWSSGLARCEI